MDIVSPDFFDVFMSLSTPPQELQPQDQISLTFFSLKEGKGM